MCGIFGLIAFAPEKVAVSTLNQLIRKLFEQSETRGKDACGVLAVSDAEILVYKVAYRAKRMLGSSYFSEVLAKAGQEYAAGKAFVIAGHTRMVTNGSEENDENNQPVVKDALLLLHNGIIVNEDALWQSNPDWQRKYQVDTEVFADLLTSGMHAGQTMPDAMRQALAATQGANTIAAIHARQDAMLLGTSNGSLYYWTAPALGLCLFGSEEFILDQGLRLLAGMFAGEMPAIQQVRPMALLSLPLRHGEPRVLAVNSEQDAGTVRDLPREIRQLREPASPNRSRVMPFSNPYTDIERLMTLDRTAISALKRCSKCLLPETFPFISFDHHGVCQFCRQHRPLTLRGTAALEQLAEQSRRSNGQADCLVPISGGRDSCYGLHYVKKELGLNPVAYTYDWGFVTDLARRNISRLCGELNIEHVVVAADIKQKRENVRKNVSAWLAKPTLSMIPLFMAGDKAFFHYASMVKRQMQLGPILFSMNWLEKTGFKTGFAGVNDTDLHDKTYGLSAANQVRLLSHYALNFLGNPRYINSTIPDTLFGYMSYYLQQKDYFSIFDYLTWDQNEIERNIIDGYGWETAPDTKSTWRIGDGTAPFYNYIYLAVAGFSEHDTFRSNQIREGMIDRASAMQAIAEENQPRAESFKWYCDTVGLDAIAALKAINRTPKLYVSQ